MTKLFTTPKTSNALAPFIPILTEYVWDGSKETDLHSIYQYPIPREVAIDTFTTGKWTPAYSLQELLDWVYAKSGYTQSDIRIVGNSNTPSMAAELILKIETRK